MTIEIRDAHASDAPALAAIYGPFVLRSASSFELEPPDADEFARRVERARSRWAYLVAERAGEVVAYAYGGVHRSRAAYAWSVETSIYVDERHHGQGVGRVLYPALLVRLSERGYRNAFAGITLPNPASVALHRAVGFQPIGTFPRIGFKLGAWHDVAWMHRPLGAGDVEHAPDDLPR